MGRTKRKFLPDTGATINMGSLTTMTNMGLQWGDLEHSQMTVRGLSGVFRDIWKCVMTKITCI